MCGLLYSNLMSVRGKNPTAFQGTGTGNKEQIIGKSFKSFIYFLIFRNLCANCYSSEQFTRCSLLVRNSSLDVPLVHYQSRIVHYQSGIVHYQFPKFTTSPEQFTTSPNQFTTSPEQFITSPEQFTISSSSSLLVRNSSLLQFFFNFRLRQVFLAIKLFQAKKSLILFVGTAFLVNTQKLVCGLEC